MLLGVLPASLIQKERISCSPHTNNGTIPFTVENLSQMPFSSSLSDHRKSEDVRIGDITWSILLGKVHHPENLDTLSFWVRCRFSESCRWFCYADLEFRLVSRTEQQNGSSCDSITWRTQRLFAQMDNDAVHQEAGFDDFDDFNLICEPKNGFVANDSIHVEVVVRDMRSFVVTDFVSPIRRHPVSGDDYSDAISQLLCNPHMSDVTFRVGDWSFPAHKLVVCTRSPAMFDMMQVRLPHQRLFCADHLQPAAFLSLLSLIYRKEIVLNEMNMMDVFQCATYFGLPEVRQACLSLISESNVFRLISWALQNDEVYDACIKVIACNMERLVVAEGWRSLHKRVLKSITVRDELNISEKGLFDAVENWAKAQSVRTGKSLRETGEDLIHNIRFTNMSVEEFGDGPSDSGLLDPKDALEIFKYLTNRTKPLPKNFVSRVRKPVVR